MKSEQRGLSKLELPEGVRSLVALMDGGLATGGSLKRPRIWAYGLMVITALLLIWVVMAPVERVVRGEGRVVPSGKNRVVQHLEGGVVSAIHVKEGQAVKAGEALVDISSTDADSQLRERSIKLHGLLAKAARLQAEADGEEMPASPASGEDSEAWALEKQTYLGRRQRLAQNQSVLAEQVTQRQAEISELTSRSQNLASELATTQKQLETQESLLQRRAGSELEVLEARLRVQRLITQKSEVDQRLPQLHSAVREINGRIQSERATFRAESRAELALVSTEARAIEEELRSRTERLNRTAIVSPVDGVINRLLVTSQGSVVRPGEVVAEVTPTGGVHVMEAQIAPSDRAELRPGLTAMIKLSPYDYTKYGVLTGTVDDISADALSDDKGHTFYRMRMIVPNSAVASFGQPILPGMPMTVDVVLSKRTIGSYIASGVLRFKSSALRDAR